MNFADQDYCIGRGLAALRPRFDSDDAIFAKHAIEFNASWLHRRSQGSTFAAVAGGDLRAMPLPSLRPADRKKIAAILTSLDTAIEKTEALIEKHQQIKAGLMQALFTRGVLPNGQLRAPRELAPALYRQTSLGWLPVNWSANTLRAVLSEGASNGIYKPAEQIGHGALLVGQTALTPERSIDAALCRRAGVLPSELRRFGLRTGDVLVSRVFATVDGVGQPALVPDLAEPAVFESNMMRLRVDVGRMKPAFLFEWLLGDAARRHVAASANASNQSSVNQSVMYPMPIAVPPLDEQDTILGIREQCMAQLQSAKHNNAKLVALKQGLMQGLLTGQLPVQSRLLEPEPANV